VWYHDLCVANVLLICCLCVAIVTAKRQTEWCHDQCVVNVLLMCSQRSGKLSGTMTRGGALIGRSAWVGLAYTLIAGCVSVVLLMCAHVLLMCAHGLVSLAL
jgi:hypothetical protein